jgi:1-acyl-sn-glycerol-3-phosphate acyltransferase
MMEAVMNRPYKQPIVKASPDIKVPEPRISKLVIFLVRLVGRLYLFLFYGIAKMTMKEDRHLFEAFRRALAGESRCIIAFRHPNGGEPQVLSWFFLFKLRVLAARNGFKFKRWPHAVFVYGYEVVRWGGWVARFVMPNAGAMPIHHTKIDSKGMERIYNTIMDGPYPVAIAPEGQVSYTTDAIPRLEPGVIRIGFTAAERLAEKGVNLPVEILPVSIHFRFGSWGNFTLEYLLKRIEKICGIPTQDRKALPFIDRIKQCREHILEVNERRYQIKSDPSIPFEERLERVIYTALETAERLMGIKGEGNFFPRMYRVRQFFWDQVFIPGMESFGDKSYVEQCVMDLKAGEAWYMERHLELVDFCWYFRGPLPGADATAHTKIEYVQNLWDFANRTMGGAFFDRKSILPRKVIIHAAPAINLSERLPKYMQGKKSAIAEALSDLEKAYLDSIKEASDPDWSKNLKNR